MVSAALHADPYLPVWPAGTLPVYCLMAWDLCAICSAQASTVSSNLVHIAACRQLDRIERRAYAAVQAMPVTLQGPLATKRMSRLVWLKMHAMYARIHFECVSQGSVPCIASSFISWSVQSADRGICVAHSNVLE